MNPIDRIHTLHVLNKAPSHPRHTLCLSAIGPDDALLLTENGVLATTAMAPHAKQCFALSADLEARGLVSPAEGVEVVSYDDMVALAAAAGKVISW